MLTFLESVGRRSEAELYLKLFRKLPKESFAIIAPGGPVVRHALGSLVEQLRFLSDLDLFAPVVLGLFNPEAAAAGSERLVKRLPSVGLEACPHEMSEPGLAERLREELRSERLPIVHFRSQEGVGYKERLLSLAALSRELDTRKVVLLRRRGGLVEFLPKGMQGAFGAARTMEKGGRLGILVDVKENKGIEVPFFGHAAMTGTVPFSTQSSAACHMREWNTPSAASRSLSSDRSRPAQKCSPSPSITAAFTLAGRFWKASRIARIRPSLSALRLAGRVRVTMAISCCSPCSCTLRSGCWVVMVVRVLELVGCWNYCYKQ